MIVFSLKYFTMDNIEKHICYDGLIYLLKSNNFIDKDSYPVVDNYFPVKVERIKAIELYTFRLSFLNDLDVISTLRSNLERLKKVNFEYVILNGFFVNNKYCMVFTDIDMNNLIGSVVVFPEGGSVP